jgi:hypothetical protein
MHRSGERVLHLFQEQFIQSLIVEAVESRFLKLATEDCATPVRHCHILGLL